MYCAIAGVDGGCKGAEEYAAAPKNGEMGRPGVGGNIGEGKLAPKLDDGVGGEKDALDPEPEAEPVRELVLLAERL